VAIDLGTGGRWHHPLHHLGAREGDDGITDGHPHGNASRMSAELGAARALAGVITTVWLGIAAHSLTVKQFGVLTLVLSLGSLVSLLTDLGVPLALSKVSCDNERLDRTAVYGAIGRRITAGWLAAVLLIALWANSGHAARWWLAGVYGVSVVVTTISGSALAALRGRAIGVVEAGYELGSQVFLLIAGLIAVSAGLQAAGVIVAYALTDTLASILVPVFARRYLKITLDPDQAMRDELSLAKTLPLVTADVLGNAYERIDIWLLALLEGTTSVAFYVAAYKLYDSILLPAKAIASSAIAAAGRDILHDGRTVARRLAARSMAITAPLSILLALIAPQILKIGFGNHYGKDPPTLYFLLIAAVPSSALVVITPIILLCRRRFVIWWTAAGLVANIVANLILIPSVGIRGAAAAFLITECGLVVAFWIGMPVPTPKPPEASVSPT
jgi:O-antigen/teichoic acid export membrane protein